MRAKMNFQDYPENSQQTKFYAADGKTEIVLSLDTVLRNAVATKVLKLELKNNVGEVAEMSTTIQLDSDDLLDVFNGLKQISTLMTETTTN